jgi:hypothetical protein
MQFTGLLCVQCQSSLLHLITITITAITTRCLSVGAVIKLSGTKQALLPPTPHFQAQRTLSPF